MKISRCRLADYVKTSHKKACCTCSTIIFLYSTNQINDLWRFRWRRQIVNSLISRVHKCLRVKSTCLSVFSLLPQNFNISFVRSSYLCVCLEEVSLAYVFIWLNGGKIVTANMNTTKSNTPISLPIHPQYAMDLHTVKGVERPFWNRLVRKLNEWAILIDQSTNLTLTRNQAYVSNEGGTIYLTENVVE